MARVIYSGIVSQIKGSIGGTTFQQNNSGSTARQKSSQRFFPSTLQGGSRSDFSNIATSWSRLALSIQQLWNAYAAVNPITDRWGNVRTLTGFQMYMQSNLNLLSIGVTLLANPPAWLPATIVPNFEITAFTNSLHLNFYPAINEPNCDLCIYASAPTTSSKLTNRKNIWLIGHFASPSGGIFDITTMYQNTFGLTWGDFFNAASCNIILQLIFVNRVTGVASPFTGNILSIRNAPEPSWSSLFTSVVNLGKFGTSDAVLCVKYLGNGILLAGCNSPAEILRSTNSGANWSSLGAFGSMGNVRDFLNLGNGVVLACGGSLSHVLRSTDYGLSWSVIPFPTSSNASYSFCVLPSGRILLGTTYVGSIYYSDDNGLNWSLLVSLPSILGFTKLLYLESGILLGFTFSPASVYRSVDMGVSWSWSGQLFSQAAFNTGVYCGNGICLGGTTSGGLVLRSINYGQTWLSSGQLFTQSSIYYLLYVGNGYVFAACGQTGKLLRSSDYGVSWVDLGSTGFGNRSYWLERVSRSLAFVSTGNVGNILQTN